MAMDWSLKPCAIMDVDVVDKNKKILVELDRLTSLPDELLIRIFALLPTKDVAATCFLNRRLSLVFPFITTLDFDPKPISLCVRKPNAIHRYPKYISFVDTVLQAHRSKYLTRFRLHVGRTCFFSTHSNDCSLCSEQCLPDLNSSQLISWISFPLNLCGLKELDLCVVSREQRNVQLPPAIFTCPTLEVLKLEVNLGLDEICSAPSYHLPNLRLLTFCTTFLPDDGFLPRLLACCPLLEDLTYTVFPRHHVGHVTVQSTSLKRLSLHMEKLDEFETDKTGVVLIHTPALEYLRYLDTLAVSYSIPIMHSLVSAELHINNIVDSETIEVPLQQLINLITSVSYVQRLILSGNFLEEFHNDDVNNLKDQLPMLPNLNYLELYCPYEDNWNTFLLQLLNRSPVLETLVLPEGILYGYSDRDFDEECHKLEREFWRTVHPIPSCCTNHLRRIVIKKYVGLPREAHIVQFFLRHALVLEELIIYLNKARPRGFPVPDQLNLFQRSEYCILVQTGACLGFSMCDSSHLVSSMDWSLKPCPSSYVDKRNLLEVDRLTTLPNQLLIPILPLLPPGCCCYLDLEWQVEACFSIHNHP